MTTAMMTISKRLALAIVLLCATLGLGQTTAVTLNATDADGQAWANGTYEFDIYSPPGVPSGKYNVNGVALSPTTYTGFLDSSGNASVMVTSNTSIIPTGTKWMIQVCPQATSQCYTQAVAITGASQSVNLTPPAIRVGPLGRITAYADTEIVTPFVGNCYYNLAALATKCYNGTAWVQGGSGGGTPSGSFNTLQFNSAGNFGGITDWTSNGTTTITGTAGSIFDMHAGTSFFLPGSLASGLVTVTTSTGATGSLASPTAPNGVPESVVCTPSSGSCNPIFALDSTVVNTQTGNYTIAVTDRGAVVRTADATNDAYTAPDPTASGFTNNFAYGVCNDGSGTLTESRSGTSLLNGATSIVIAPAWCGFHYTDNTNWYVYLFPQATGFPNSTTNSALTYNSATGSFSSLTNIVQYNALLTGTHVPVAAGASNTTTNQLQDGYAVQGTDPNLATITNVIQDQPVCGDQNLGLSPCTVAGQSNYPVSYQARSQYFGFSINAASTVANTTTSTTLLSSFEGNQTILAGTMIPGGFGIKTIRINGEGTFGSITTPNLTINVILGGTTLGSLTLSSVPATGHWTLDFFITVVDLNNVRYGGCFTYNVNGSSPTATCASGTHPSLNFAVDQALDIQAAWSVASASNTVTADVLTAFPVHSM